MLLHIHRTRDEDDPGQGHSVLNPSIFNGDKLKPAVRDKLLSDAARFQQFLKVPNLPVTDVILTGSNASYNYTPESDIDVHLLVDFTKLPFSDIADNYFMAEKKVWQDNYDSRIYNMPVEFYVQDTRGADRLTANGVYSLTQNKWTKYPKTLSYADPKAVDAKYNDYKHRIDTLLAGLHTIKQIDDLSDKIYDLRKSGLKKGGELSVENVTFKKLRNNGDLRRLDDEQNRLTSRELSLSATKDAYDPSEKRDPGGKWTSGGGGSKKQADPPTTLFASPNVEEHLTFEQAVKGLQSPRQKLLAAFSHDIDKTLGINDVRINHVVGAWADGAENSVMTNTARADPDIEKVAAAAKGFLADQKAVLLFRPDENGHEFMAQFRTKGDLGDIHQQLLDDGVQFHTLEPRGSDVIIHVYGDSPQTLEVVSKAAKRYNAQVDVHPGNGAFIGTTKEDGTDEEQREDARSIYTKTIEGVAATGKLPDKWRTQWQNYIDNWQRQTGRQATGGIAESKDEFDPSQERDPSGKWTSGGGSSTSTTSHNVPQKRLDELKSQGFDTSRVLYHQTSTEAKSHILEDGFDLNKGREILTDEAVPDGVFLKPTDANIGVEGAEQIPLFAKMKNTLKVFTQKQLKDKLSGQDEEYRKLAATATKTDRDFAEEEKKFKSVRGLPPGEREQLIADKEEFFKRWNAENERTSTAARKRATQVLKDQGYDSVEISQDVGGFGKGATKTIIVFGGENSIAHAEGDAKVLPIKGLTTKDYDPSEKRDPGGRFATGGTSTSSMTGHNPFMHHPMARGGQLFSIHGTEGEDPKQAAPYHKPEFRGYDSADPDQYPNEQRRRGWHLETGGANEVRKLEGEWISGGAPGGNPANVQPAGGTLPYVITKPRKRWQFVHLYTYDGKFSISFGRTKDKEPFDETKHPQAPAGAPGGKGGQFVSKGEGTGGSGAAATAKASPRESTETERKAETETPKPPVNLSHELSQKGYEYADYYDGIKRFVFMRQSKRGSIEYSAEDQGFGNYWEHNDPDNNRRYSGNGYSDLIRHMNRQDRGQVYDSKLAEHYGDNLTLSGFDLFVENSNAAAYKNSSGDEVYVYKDDDGEELKNIEDAKWAVFMKNEDGVKEYKKGQGTNELNKIVSNLAEAHKEEGQKRANEKAHMGEAMHRTATNVVNKLGYDMKRVEFSDEDKLFTLNGTQHHYAGAAYIASGPNKGKIVLYTKHLDPLSIRPVAAHEVMHQKFQAALEDFQAEKKKVWGPDYEKNTYASGELRPGKEKEFPVYAEFYPVIEAGDVMQKLRDGDGVTNYSKMWWKEHNDGKADVQQAVHETLAEMAAQHEQTGIIPGTAAWKKLYSAVNRVYRANHWGGKNIGESEAA